MWYNEYMYTSIHKFRVRFGGGSISLNFHSYNIDRSWLLNFYDMFKALNLILNLGWWISISMVAVGLLSHLSSVHVQSASCLSVAV